MPLSPQAQALLAASGLGLEAMAAFLRGEHATLDPQAIARTRQQLAQKRYEATVHRTEGAHVIYVDADVFTETALQSFRVSRDVPYIRLVLKTSATQSGMRTTPPLAVPGSTALDLFERETGSIAAVARVVLGKRSSL